MALLSMMWLVWEKLVAWGVEETFWKGARWLEGTFWGAMRYVRMGDGYVGRAELGGEVGLGPKDD